jgi:hypothetical protein
VVFSESREDGDNIREKRRSLFFLLQFGASLIAASPLKALVAEGRLQLPTKLAS